MIAHGLRHLRRAGFTFQASAVIVAGTVSAQEVA